LIFDFLYVFYDNQLLHPSNLIYYCLYLLPHNVTLLMIFEIKKCFSEYYYHRTIIEE